MSEGPSAELPRYECHKKVWALQIKGLDYKIGNDEFVLTPMDEQYAPFVVSNEYVRKHNPKIGGYYVVYEDGYKSFSPASAFESGYVRIRP